MNIKNQTRLVVRFIEKLTSDRRVDTIEKIDINGFIVDLEE